MSSAKNTYKYTLQLIADILSFENPTQDLRQKLKKNTIDWEQFVTIASNHLVLTTCYCRLQQKKLWSHIPNDLKAYLEEITNINRNRNQTLLNEIEDITKIFNTNNINYVFLKGAALIIGDYYEDLGERMVGDIDILVDGNHIFKAFDLLNKNHYMPIEQTFGSKYFEHKHLPRLTSTTRIAAVEVHRKVLIKPYKNLLLSDKILQSKVKVGTTYIPNNNILTQHTILNFQINDLGHYYTNMSFRSIYDTLLVMKYKDVQLEGLSNTPLIKSYISMGKTFFKDFNTYKSNSLTSAIFWFKINSNSFNKLSYTIMKKLLLMKSIAHRLWYFTINKKYRRDVCRDYKRIFNLVKLKFMKS